MKRIALFLLLAATVSACKVSSPGIGTWTLQKEGDSKSYSVNVPSTVAGALNEAGFFGEGNILEGERYKTVDRDIFDDTWVYTTHFGVTDGLRHVLRFNGVGYSADIFVNGTKIASADTTFGFFSVREFDITSLAKNDNLLEVKVHRAPEASLNSGYVDWNPRPFDESMGITGPVELISTPDVEVQDVFVRPIVNPADFSAADLKIVTTLVNRSDKAVTGNIKGSYDSGAFDKEITLAPGESKEVELTEHVVNPRIWWSSEFGKPEMYGLKVAFVRDGKESHSKNIRFGIRDIASRVDEAGHRLFILNGKELLIKAAGWTDDIFMNDTPESIRTQVEFVKDVGLNCIRFENIWGKDDTVYNLCDEMGILAIVGFSCQWEWENYCGYPEVGKFGCINTPETEALAARYFHDQIIRLRNHPAVIGWLTGSDRIPNERLEKAYMEHYNKLEYRPYVCSAKEMTSKYGGPSGVKMEGPYEYVGPDYWYLDTECGGAYGFNTETSVGMNIPQVESVARMVGKDNLWPLNKVWDYHCTASSSDMNTTAEAVKDMTGVYGAPESLEDFMRKAHALDYDSTRAMFESFRCNVPNTTGIVQWMLNSAWPSFYWQLYDWYLVPTAGYYGTKKACLPVQLVYNYGDDAVYIVDDAIPEESFTAYMTVYGPDSKVIRQEEKPVTAIQRKPHKVFEGITGPAFLSVSLKNADGLTVADNFYCIGAKDNVYNWKKANWYITPITEYTDLSFVSALPEANVKMEIMDTAGGYIVSVTNDSDTVAYQIILKALDGETLAPGVLWSDNFFSLGPNETRIVTCDLPDNVSSATIKLDGWNVR